MGREGPQEIALVSAAASEFYVVLQILNLIPEESEGEPFEDALARVCRVGGGGAADAGSDSDIEVVADSFSVNLRCPVSRIGIILYFLIYAGSLVYKL